MSDHTTAQQPEWAEKIRVCEFQGVEKFYDILPLMADGEAFSEATDALVHLADEAAGGNIFRSVNENNHIVDLIVSTEAWGFIFGSYVASCNNLGLVLARKPGKAPGETASVTYDKEYGRDTLEIQRGLIHEGDRVIIVNDLAATGSTLKATADLVVGQGGTVIAIITLIELTELEGRKLLEDAGYKLESVLQY